MFLLPANEVWGKVMFLHLCVILFRGGLCMMSLPVWLPGLIFLLVGLCPGGLCLGSLSRGDLCRGSLLGGSLSREDLCRGGGGSLSGGPPRMVKSGRYLSYWNAFLLLIIFVVQQKYLFTSSLANTMFSDRNP